MSRHVKIDRIELTDPEGRSRDYVTQKTMLFISCDLDGKIEITPAYSPAKKAWQIQAIAKPGHCLLANLGREPVQFQESGPANPDAPDQADQAAGPRLLSPQAVQAVPYSRPVELNGALFLFHRNRPARSIEVDFLLPDPLLRPDHTPDRPLVGLITLHNKGSQSQVQFHLRLETGHLPAGAGHLDSPHPRLAFTRQRTVKLYLYHPPNRPLPAGPSCLELYLEANEYPGQVAADFQEVQVLPFYRYELLFQHRSPCRGESK